jgi:cytochrome b subunit of formate dehydrogenase
MTGSAPVDLIRDDEVFVRMTRTERWQHLLLAGSFIVLLLTGLPVFFGLGGHSVWRGLLHRLAALVLTGDFLWHIGYTLGTERGRRNLRDRRPLRSDLEDALAPFRRRGARPGPGRYDMPEKLEYWSFLWGSVLMIVSGFLLWFPGWSLRLFPLSVHQAIVVVHGYEAVLALMSVLLWHMYSVHLKPGVFPMSRVWLDGRITGADLKKFHPLEYRRILAEREQLYRDFLALEAASGPSSGTGSAP